MDVSSAVVFWLFLLSAFGLIFRFGGLMERRFAGFLLSCSFLTLTLDGMLGMSASSVYVILIDALILIVALCIMAKSDAYWPVWFSGFHLIAVSTGLACILFPSSLPGIYADAAGFWALPALLALVIGTLADHSARNTALGPAR